MNDRHSGLATALGAAPAAALAASLVACLALASPSAQALPSFEQVKQDYRSSDTVVLDRHGVAIQTVRTQMQGLRGDWVTLPEISPALRTALLLAEDKRFYEHAGVDWRAVSAAAWGNLWNRRTRGASTLTMQLAGLLANERADRSVGAKLSQAATALRLERSWRKDQILEGYLNLVGFRGETVGISALSGQLFQKYPSGLDAVESAITAALIRAPNAPAAKVAERGCALLGQQGLAARCPALTALAEQTLGRHGPARFDASRQLAPHLARLLLARQGGRPATLKTTLDAGLQRFTRDVLYQQLFELRERHVEDGAVIVIDNASGEVLAWVGSSGELSASPEVDGVLALRQAGSTLKPFLYEIALEQRWMTAASLLDDSPVAISVGNGLYIPQNYDHEFKGRVSVRTALASSLNVPAVRTLTAVTPERFARRLKALDLPLRHAGDFYGFSLALGSAEVTLASLSNAYRALANGGRFSALQFQHGTPASAAPAPLMDPAATFIVTDILSDREARVPTFGLDNALAAHYWSAVKTGTSKDMRDNWCIGFNRQFTVGVWVGNNSGEAMWDVSGVTGAAPVWRAVMDELHRRFPDPPADPAPPPGLTRQAIAFDHHLEPARDEWFLAGSAQDQVRAAEGNGSGNPYIKAPTDGSTLALDPDIPRQAQRLGLALARRVPAGWAWSLDGKRLGPAVDGNWPLWPGMHHLALLDGRGEVMDQVRFEVRGVTLKAARKPA